MNCILRVTNKLLTVPDREVKCSDVPFRERIFVCAVGNGLEEVRKGLGGPVRSP